MFYRILADFTVIIHLLFIVFVMLGGLLLLWRKWLVLLHLPAAAWGTLVEIKGWICPLTPLENYLRAEGGSAGYPGGFVDFYIIPIIYPVGLTKEHQIELAAIAILVNLAVYAYVGYRHASNKDKS